LPYDKLAPFDPFKVRGSMTKRGVRKEASEGDKLVAARVRAARMAAGLSQERLGNALGVTFQQVQKYEKGVNRVGPGRLQKIADITNKPITFFFADMDGNPFGNDEVATVVQLMGSKPPIRRIVNRLSRLTAEDAARIADLVERLTTSADRPD
jgi:transcriptional regulator with XRE-family HTH domain